MSTRSAPVVDEACPRGEAQIQFDELFRTHAAAVFAFARRRTSAEEADEVVSETFLVAWRRLTEVPDEPRAWLLGVARNCLLNRARTDRRQRGVQARLVSIAPTGATTPTPAATPAIDAALLEALAGLPASERDALTLLAWDELTPDEAAEVLGCSRAALYVRLHRARRRLRRVLERTPATEGDLT